MDFATVRHNLSQTNRDSKLCLCSTTSPEVFVRLSTLDIVLHPTYQTHCYHAERHTEVEHSTRQNTQSKLITLLSEQSSHAKHTVDTSYLTTSFSKFEMSDLTKGRKGRVFLGEKSAFQQQIPVGSQVQLVTHKLPRNSQDLLLSQCG